MSDVSDALEQSAIDGIKSVTVDGRTVVQMDTDERIKIDQYLRGNTSAGVSGFGMRSQKIVPPEAG